jgi:CRISPR-associated protein Csb2
MFGIAIELLAGRYAATAYNDRDHVEWPPHPARLFSALVATWGGGEPLGETGAAERAALEWLEQLPPPDVLADAIEAAGLRKVVPVFVPVNDASQVAEVDRGKLDLAQAALAAATDAKTRARAEKDVDKLRAKLAADTAKAIAPSTKFSKDARTALEVLPERRGKQPRTFPTATPATPGYAFVWRDAAPSGETIVAIQRLLSQLVRVGHSSSQVRATLANDAELAELRERVVLYRPDDRDGELVLRWVAPGQLVRLCRAYDQHRETEPRVLPAQFVRYTSRPASVRRVKAHSIFTDDFVTFTRVGGPRLPITSVAGVAQQLRRALMAHADEPIHTMLSGHRPDGSPSEHPHAAVVPLPVIVGPYADGALIGIALVLPRDCEAEARHAVLRAIGKYEHAYRDKATDETPRIKLGLGDVGDLWLRRVAWSDERATLDPRTWTRSSYRWATATPIALDRNPGDLQDRDPECRRAAYEAACAIVVDATHRIGLPGPIEVDVLRSCVLPGTAKPSLYPRYPSSSDRTQRVLVHARLVFGEPVRGPVLVGAGRYHGLGLCLPVDELKERMR